MFLPTLLKKIDDFYKLALEAVNFVKSGQQGFSMPDDPEEDDTARQPDNSPDSNDEYAELIRAAQNVSDPSLSSELQLVAEMYKKALELGGGYNSINRAISNIINMYLEDEDNPEQAAIEDLLNNVSKDLRQRAGGAIQLNKPDNPAIMAQLKKFKDEYNDRAIEEEVDDLSKFEDTAVPTFDPTGGMGKDEAQKGSGRGYSVKTVKSLKDWVEHYKQEKARYEEELNQPLNRVLKPKIDKMTNVLSQLIKQIPVASQLQKDLLSDPDPAKREQLDGLLEEIRKLKEERSKVKKTLRNDLLELQRRKLEVDLNSNKSERDRFLLKQKIELNNTLASKDRNKGEEIKLRKMLISSMSDGNTLGEATLQKLLGKIEEAKNKRVSAEQNQKEQTNKIKEHFEYDESKKDKRIKAKTFEGMVIELGQKIATQKIVVKQKITDKLKAAEHTVFQPYLDAVAEAKTNGDPKMIMVAAKELQKAVNAFAEADPSVSNFVDNTKAFYDFKKLAGAIEKTKVVESNVPVPADLAAMITETINQGTQLHQKFIGVQHFKTIAEAVKNIVNVLAQRMNNG